MNSATFVYTWAILSEIVITWLNSKHIIDLLKTALKEWARTKM